MDKNKYNHFREVIKQEERYSKLKDIAQHAEHIQVRITTSRNMTVVMHDADLARVLNAYASSQLLDLNAEIEKL